MNVDIHSITDIKAEQRQHTMGAPFYCLTLEIRNEDGAMHSVRLFSAKPMTLVNPDIKVIE